MSSNSDVPEPDRKLEVAVTVPTLDGNSVTVGNEAPDSSASILAVGISAVDAASTPTATTPPATIPAPQDPVDNVSPLPLQSLVMETMADIGVDKLVPPIQGSIAHMVNTVVNNDSDPLHPLQMLQDLQLCGPGMTGMARLTAIGEDLAYPHPLTQPELRHIRSSPLQHRPSVFDGPDDEDEPMEDVIPPPIPLDPFQRSSSTPSSFRQRSIHSAFEDRIAFTSPYRYRGGASAFDPVSYYARQLEDMERTSIEVTDMRVVAEETQQKEPSPPEPKRGAASRAARFLSDVRVLRRRGLRVRSGRENPIDAITERKREEAGSKESDANVNDDAMDTDEAETAQETAITVITEPDYNPNETSMLSQSSEVSAIVGSGTAESMDTDEPEDSDHLAAANGNEAAPNVKEDSSPMSKYAQLDSNVDEEGHYHQIEAQLQQSESPGPVPSPVYQRFVDDRAPNTATPPNARNSSSLRIKFMDKQPVASPSPTGMSVNGDSANESPVTARSGSTSGHTTQATSTSSIMGNSGLSRISETDREVMEANKHKEGKLRNFVQVPVSRKHESDITSLHSASTTSSHSHGYMALDNSPVVLRDGANVPVDRFFTGSPGSTNTHGVVRSSTNNSNSTRQSGNTTSPSASHCDSGVHTTSTGSSRDEPPTFVSYLDKMVELVSVREAAEQSSPRTIGVEEREASPAEMGHLLFEAANGPKKDEKIKVVCPNNHRVRFDKFRARPPRSPYKGGRAASTPPPRGSPLQHHLSPPRNIVDHPGSKQLSKPNVMRSVASTSALPGANVTTLSRIPDYENYEEEVIMSQPLYGGELMKGRTYADGNVEIMQTSATEELSPQLPS